MSSLKKCSRLTYSRVWRSATCVVAFGATCVLIAMAMAETRVWTDSTGKHKIRGEFVKLDKDVVTLQKEDGKQVAIPLDKLSRSDRAMARSLAGLDEETSSSKSSETSGKSGAGKTSSATQGISALMKKKRKDEEAPKVGVDDKSETRPSSDARPRPPMGGNPRPRTDGASSKLSKGAPYASKMVNTHLIGLPEMSAAYGAPIQGTLKQLTVQGNEKWRYSPQPRRMERFPERRITQVEPVVADDRKSHTDYSRFRVCWPRRETFVGYKRYDFDKEMRYERKVVRHSLDDGRLLQSIDLPDGFEFDMVSPDGNLILAKSHDLRPKLGEDLPSPGNALLVYGRTDDAYKPLYAWYPEPYRRGSTYFSGDIEFVTDDIVVVSSSGWDTEIAWRLTPQEPVPLHAMLPGQFSRALFKTSPTGDGKTYFVASNKGVVAILEAETGDVQGVVHSGVEYPLCASFSPSGERLAVSSLDEVAVLNLREEKVEIRHHIQTANLYPLDPTWVDERLIFIGDKVILDSKTNLLAAEIWDPIGNHNHFGMPLGNDVVYVSDGNLLWWSKSHERGLRLLTQNVLDTGLSDILDSVDTDERHYVVRPGSEVAVVVENGTKYTDELREGLRKAVEENGFKIVDSADIAFVGRMTPEPVQQLRLLSRGRFGWQEHIHDFHPAKFELRLMDRGTQAWNASRTSDRMDITFMPADRKTPADEVIAREEKRLREEFGRVFPPKTVFRYPQNRRAFSSLIFKDDGIKMTRH